MIHLELWPTLAFVVMALSWLAFVITFVFHKKPPSPPDQKRDPTSIIGIVFQGLSYAIVWTIRRPWFTAMFPNKSLEIGLAVLTMILAVFSVWFSQYKFFRRYGLQDNTSVVLNGVLLFVVLFYVYPLKFLFTLLVNIFTGGGGQVRMPDGTTGLMVENGDQVSTLMIIFGAGYVAVFGVFVLLYWHAYRQREALELNELEVFDTRVDIRESALNVGIALLSITIAFIGRGRFAFLSGITYMLNGILSPLHGTMMGRRRRKLEEQFDAKRSAAPATD